MGGHLPSRKHMRRLCAEFTEGDGLEMRKSLPSHPRRRSGHGAGVVRDDRKSLQLCRQIAQTLDEVFAECRDDTLRALHVIAVDPAPDSSRLLVTVVPDGGLSGDGLDPATILNHLVRASGHLRGEVATAITRKRTPLLSYRIAASHIDSDVREPS